MLEVSVVTVTVTGGSDKVQQPVYSPLLPHLLKHMLCKRLKTAFVDSINQPFL